MRHQDHVNLLKPAGLPPDGAWADLGAGSGAFTLALRDLLGRAAEIYAVDKEGARLEELKQAFRSRFGAADHLHTLQADFSKGLPELPALDGILMANSLHFFRDKVRILDHVRGALKPAGLLLLVEYNVDKGNPWVPYPLSFSTFKALARSAGFSEPRLLATYPSSFLHEFYAAAAEHAA